MRNSTLKEAILYLPSPKLFNLLALHACGKPTTTMCRGEAFTYSAQKRAPTLLNKRAAFEDASEQEDGEEDVARGKHCFPKSV